MNDNPKKALRFGSNLFVIGVIFVDNVKTSISKKVKKHGIGVICVEKGRSQKYVDYSQDMAFDILDVYGLIGRCNN